MIRHTGTMARFVLGELNGERSERVGAWQARCGPPLSITGRADIRRDIWDKMVFLATFAGLTALLRLPIGPIRGDADARAMLRAGLQEAHAVARAKGIALSDGFVERTLAGCDGLPHEMKSSMLQDLERGRRLELPWLSGTIARLGQGSASPPRPTPSSPPHSSCTPMAGEQDQRQGAEASIVIR